MLHPYVCYIIPVQGAVLIVPYDPSPFPPSFSHCLYSHLFSFLLSSLFPTNSTRPKEGIEHPHAYVEDFSSHGREK